MPRRIQEDHGMFRDVVGGATRRELGKYIKSGAITRKRGKNTVSIPIPQIGLPHFAHGSSDEGVGRGAGKPGTKVGEDPAPGKGGKQAGTDPGSEIEVAVDMKDVLALLQDDWKLPNMLPKEGDTFEEVVIKYDSLSKVGPSALLHKRRTLLNTLKRQSAMGLLSEEHAVLLPGYKVPIIPLIPIADDKRFRQWNEHRVPTSNAVIFFARDISGSMDNEKCEIVSDMSWWIDTWIRQFYDRTDRVYVVHDTKAKEVDEEAFYKLRMGGGTMCSSAVRHIAEQIKHRYNPETWNIYVFYFSDGDNWGDDNAKFVKTISEKLKPGPQGNVNLFGLTQILPWASEGLKEYVDKEIVKGKLDNRYVRSVGIDNNADAKRTGWGYYRNDALDEDARNLAIKKAIQDLLGTHPQLQKLDAAV